MTSRFLTPTGQRLSETEGRILRAVRELSIPSPHFRGAPEPTLYQVARHAGLVDPLPAETLLPGFVLAAASGLIARGLLQLGERGGVTA